MSQVQVPAYHQIAGSRCLHKSTKHPKKPAQGGGCGGFCVNGAMSTPIATQNSSTVSVRSWPCSACRERQKTTQPVTISRNRPNGVLDQLFCNQVNSRSSYSSFEGSVLTSVMRRINRDKSPRTSMMCVSRRFSDVAAPCTAFER